MERVLVALEDNHDIIIDDYDSRESVVTKPINKTNFGDVAKIGNTTYPSIKDAIESVNTSDQTTIELLKNFDTAISYIDDGKIGDLYRNVTKNLMMRLVLMVLF